jgi:competence protein ComEC
MTGLAIPGRVPGPWRPPARVGLMLPDGVAATTNRLCRLLSQWVLAEVAPGRLMPWLPVGFGFGIVVYFAAEREPAMWAASALACAAITIAVLARRSGVGFVLGLGFAAIATGLAVATVHAARIAHPILAFPTWSAKVAGFVEQREERERSDRVVVQVNRIGAPRMRVKPERVRVAVRKGTAPPVGSFVAFKAYPVSAAAALASGRL